MDNLHRRSRTISDFFPDQSEIARVHRTKGDKLLSNLSPNNDSVSILKCFNGSYPLVIYIQNAQLRRATVHFLLALLLSFRQCYSIAFFYLRVLNFSEQSMTDVNKIMNCNFQCFTPSDPKLNSPYWTPHIPYNLLLRIWWYIMTISSCWLFFFILITHLFVDVLIL